MTICPRLTKLWTRFVCVYVLLWWVEGNFAYISRGYFMSTDVIIRTDQNAWWLSSIIFYQISYTTYFDKIIKYIICPSLRLTFYTPVWKSVVLYRDNDRLSVCQSVHPSFRTFSTCFGISIWNLLYTFSRWHDMSSLSFIAIGSNWPTLQPKVNQIHFSQSWHNKSR